MSRPRSSTRSRRADRSGQVVAELALVMPLLLLLVAAGVELTGAASAKSALGHAAREGIRRASLAGSTEADVLGVVERELELAGLDLAAATVVFRCDGAAGLCGDPGTTDEISIEYPYATVLLGSVFTVTCSLFGCGEPGPATLTLSASAAAANE